jgi:Transposase DDE domain
VHSADDWEELLLPEIERQQRQGKNVVFRADAALVKLEIFEALEQRGVKYAIRVRANENLERDVAELLLRPVGWGTKAFSTRPPVGRRPGEWWRSLSIMPGSCSRASGS